MKDDRNPATAYAQLPGAAATVTFKPWMVTAIAVVLLAGGTVVARQLAC